MNRGTTRLPRESAKRKTERPTRHQIIEAAHNRDRDCQFPTYLAAHLVRQLHGARNLRHPEGIPVRCMGPLDVHEVIPRDAWRAGYLVLDNVVLLCRHHHDWVTDNPTDAHLLHLHGYSWERPK